MDRRTPSFPLSRTHTYALVLSGMCVSLLGFPLSAIAATEDGNQTPAPVTTLPKTALAVPSATLAVPLNRLPASMVQTPSNMGLPTNVLARRDAMGNGKLDQTLAMPVKMKKKARKDLPGGVSETVLAPVLIEVQRLRWDPTPEDASTADTKRLSLDKVFELSLDHSILVRQAAVRIKDAEAQSKAWSFNLNPVSLAALRKAAAADIESAKAHLDVARQKTLLDSAKAYADLTKAYLGKYLAYQAIEQGCQDLRAEEQRFQSGENTHFDVTQTEIELINRYEQYMNADNAYRASAMSLSVQMGLSSQSPTWIPEDGLSQSTESLQVKSINLIPGTLTLDVARQGLERRPDLQEMNHQKEALENLVKGTSGVDREKHKSELHQLELESVKARMGADAMLEKAYNEVQLGVRDTALAQQRYLLADHFVHQLQISREAGFSSTNDVLDGEVALSKSKSAWISAQLTANQSQIQLLYEMGQLNQDALNHLGI